MVACATAEKTWQAPFGQLLGFLPPVIFIGAFGAGTAGSTHAQAVAGLHLQRPQARELSGSGGGALRLVAQAGCGRARWLWRAQVIDWSSG